MRRAALAVLGFALACGGTKPAAVTVAAVPEPSVSPSAAPALPQLARDPFDDAGCTRSADNRSLLDCKNARIAGVGACKRQLHELRVTFDPPAAVAECFVDGGALQSVRRTGCMMPVAVRLIAATPSGFVTLDSPAALAKAFAPVTSPAEAIAFAVALTGSDEVRSTDKGATLLGTTQAKPDGDGFRVRLFWSPMCGCSHPTYGIDYAVTRAGAVSEVSRDVVLDNAGSEGLCVD